MPQFSFKLTKRKKIIGEFFMSLMDRLKEKFKISNVGKESLEEIKQVW